LVVVVYLIQVNQGATIDFQLGQARALLVQGNAENARLLATRDSLVAESRISFVATTKLHMRLPSLDSALWLSVPVPAIIPTAPREPVVRTSPLVWLESAVRTVRDSL